MPLLAAGTTIGRYTVQHKLATGGMAEVYLAHQSGSKGYSRQVALKVILPQLASDPHLLRMFHDEAKLAALLNHEGIVQIYDMGADNETHFIAMEYVDGVTLRRIVTRLAGRRLRMRRPLAIRIVSDACRALDHAHKLTDAKNQPLQIVHRDISLENVLVSYTGQVKLVDFGIAKARTMESYTRTGVVKGKFEYMPPEVIEGERPDHRMDIYATGVVLYLLLLGRAPFVGQNEVQLMDRILVDPPPRPQVLDPDFPRPLELILLKALEKDPGLRHQSAADLADELDEELSREELQRPSKADLASFVVRLLPPTTDPTFEPPAVMFPTQAPPTQPPPTRPPQEPLQFAPTDVDGVQDIMARMETGRRPGGLKAIPSDWPTNELPPEQRTEEMVAPPPHMPAPEVHDSHEETEFDPAMLPTEPLPAQVDPALLPTVPVPPTAPRKHKPNKT